MPTTPHHRARTPRQTSPLLTLPREILHQIYTLCLHAPTPLNLCPQTHCHDTTHLSEIALTNPLYTAFLHPSLQSQLHTRHNSNPSSAFRLQPSLLHTRTALATNLLSTCRKIYVEAAPIFWTENTWRFSHDERWEMLWRWLLTIGPAARARVQKLEVFAPFASDPMEGCGMFGGGGPGYYKNHPKMRFDKVIKYRGGGEREEEGDCRHKVFELLIRERLLEAVTFVVPCGFCVYGDDSIRELPLGFSSKVTVVLEPGGWLDGLLGVRDFLDEGFDLVAAPDHYGHDMGGLNDSRTVINPTQEWKTWRATPDFLRGVSRLFEEEELGTPANGGRAYVPGKGKSLTRELKGFRLSI